MRHKTRFLLAALFAAASVSAYADVPLKIWTGDRRTDTVSSAREYIIGVTAPGGTARIGGEDCHVYRTGSFGREVNLAEGENFFEVSVSKGGETAVENVRLVYVTRITGTLERQATVEFDEPLRLVTLPGAYLQYGNGGDRLGGSKMGYVDADIPLTATAEVGGLYRVRLGENGFAFVPKSYVAEGGQGHSLVNTGSASLASVGRNDRLTLSLPQRLPYQAWTEIDPNTICVKVFGAMNNSNWITRRGETGIVDYVDFRQDESDALTLVLRLKDRSQWGYAIHYEGNSLVVDVRHRPASLAISDLTIGLDAGHGGPYPGAWSPSGLNEKEVNLDIVLEMARILRGMGANVVLTRDGDTGPSMTERKRIWLEGNVDLAISVHNNSSGNPLIPMGTSCYYKHLANRALASSLHQAVLGLGVADFGLTGNFNFALNQPTEYPNALVEVLFMSSLPEEELLADPEYRKRLAAAIVDGLLNYLREA